jgi:hypothetical protein
VLRRYLLPKVFKETTLLLYLKKKKKKELEEMASHLEMRAS